MHNLSEEHSGFVIYEWQNIRGKQYLESVSKKMIVNKGIDILENSINNESIKMKAFIKPSKAIKEIKLNWNERLEQHQTEEYSKQECLNLKPEANKI